MKVHSKTSKLYFFICFLFLIAVVVRPAQLIYQQRENFFSPGYNKQYESLKSSYYNSQYVKKKNPYIMPDEVFESFVGVGNKIAGRRIESVRTGNSGAHAVERKNE